MRTLDEDIDDLDRMIDGGADVARMRSQLAFIRSQVTALQAKYLEIEDANLKLYQALSEEKDFKTPPGSEGLCGADER